MYGAQSFRASTKEHESKFGAVWSFQLRSTARLVSRVVLSILFCKPMRVLLIALQCGIVIYLIASLTRGRSAREAIETELLASSEQRWVVRDRHNATFEYSRASPLVWIGGVPRSGTTLMRVILDAHGDVRCGAETRVIPRMLAMRAQWIASTVESDRLREAGVDEAIMDHATASFLMEVLTRYEEPARVLCNKDPFALKYSTWLFRIFPNSRFILMLRDGRAVVHSIITRQVTVSAIQLLFL